MDDWPKYLCIAYREHESWVVIQPTQGEEWSRFKNSRETHDFITAKAREFADYLNDCGVVLEEGFALETNRYFPQVLERYGVKTL